MGAGSKLAGLETRFVLVEPRSGGNVGAAARAMKNFGFERLALVRPQCDPRGAEARRLAVDAADLLDRAGLHATLDEALRGARTVVGATRRTGKHRRPHYRLDAWAEELAELAARGELAVLFGREDRGLEDDELDRCTHLVQFPSSEAYPSCNLAQSVLLVAWELRRAELDPSDAAELGPPAPHEAREAFYAHLQRSLTAIGFLHDDSREAIMRRFRRLLGRAELTDEDVALLRGLARQILWAASRAGLAEPPDEPSDEPSDEPRG